MAMYTIGSGLDRLGWRRRFRILMLKLEFIVLNSFSIIHGLDRQSEDLLVILPILGYDGYMYWLLLSESSLYMYTVLSLSRFLSIMVSATLS